ncbi:TPA: hypothetical protein ACGO7Q_000998 [Streptococcus suis]
MNKIKAVAEGHVWSACHPEPYLLCLIMKEIEGIGVSLFFHRMSISCYQVIQQFYLGGGNSYGKTIKN